MYDFRSGYENQTLELKGENLSAANKTLSDAMTALRCFHELVNKGAASAQTAHSVLYSLESYAGELGKLCNVQTESESAREARYGALRQANERIRALEQELGNQSDHSSIVQGLKTYGRAVEKWWDTYGFGHISELRFTSGATLELKLSCLLLGTPFELPVARHENESGKDAWHRHLEELGYDLREIRSENDTVLLDTPQNRDLLLGFVRKAFPSARVLGMKTSFTQEVAHIRELHLYVADLQDVQRLAQEHAQTGTSP